MCPKKQLMHTHTHRHIHMHKPRMSDYFSCEDEAKIEMATEENATARDGVEHIITERNVSQGHFLQKGKYGGLKRWRIQKEMSFWKMTTWLWVWIVCLPASIKKAEGCRNWWGGIIVRKCLWMLLMESCWWLYVTTIRPFPKVTLYLLLISNTIWFCMILQTYICMSWGILNRILYMSSLIVWLLLVIICLDHSLCVVSVISCCCFLWYRDTSKMVFGYWG